MTYTQTYEIKIQSSDELIDISQQICDALTNGLGKLRAVISSITADLISSENE